MKWNISGNIACDYYRRFKKNLDKIMIIIIIIIIIMYIYHAVINARSAHMIHINLNKIFYTHVEHLSLIHI